MWFVFLVTILEKYYILLAAFSMFLNSWVIPLDHTVLINRTYWGKNSIANSQSQKSDVLNVFFVGPSVQNLKMQFTITENQYIHTFGKLEPFAT